MRSCMGDSLQARTATAVGSSYRSNKNMWTKVWSRIQLRRGVDKALAQILLAFWTVSGFLWDAFIQIDMRSDVPSPMERERSVLAKENAAGRQRSASEPRRVRYQSGVHRGTWRAGGAKGEWGVVDATEVLFLFGTPSYSCCTSGPYTKYLRLDSDFPLSRDHAYVC
jgi:hypothetical protein